MAWIQSVQSCIGQMQEAVRAWTQAAIAWLIEALQLALVYTLAAATVIGFVVLIVMALYLRDKDIQEQRAQLDGK